MLDDQLLEEYCEKFFGYGNWAAPIWFVGIEESGGHQEAHVRRHLRTWDEQGRKDLEEAPIFYPASGNALWHGPMPVLQRTWKQLIRILFVTQGNEDTESSLRQYQIDQFGTARGEICLVELFPLPCPSVREEKWKYNEWSSLDWLRSRKQYETHLKDLRISFLRNQLEKYRPETVIFYGWGHRPSWSKIGGVNSDWHCLSIGRLLKFARNGSTFFVTRHPTDRIFTDPDKEFQEIGRLIRESKAEE